MSVTTEKRDVSPANNLAFDLRPSGKSLMYIRKSKGPRTEPCGTPALTSSHDEFVPLRTTRCLRLCKKSSIILYRFPSIP